MYDASKRGVLGQYDVVHKQIEELAASLTSEADKKSSETLRDSLRQWQTAHTQMLALSDSGAFAAAQQLITTTVDPLLKTAEGAAQEIAVEEGIEPEALYEHLHRLGTLRAKGFVQTSQGLRLVQGVGRRIELTEVTLLPPAALLLQRRTRPRRSRLSRRHSPTRCIRV